MKHCTSKSLIPIFFLGLGLLEGQTVLGQNLRTDKVAFLADIHLQDVYGNFESDEFKGILLPKTGRYATIRTMEAQLNSTRLYNENYFALYAALDELVKKEIKLVVLPGDFTDDGQPMNVSKLRQILDDYEKRHQMRFFITTGNHDPVSPFQSPGGKSDFMGENGNAQAISSENIANKNLKGELAISPQIAHWGYAEIIHELQDFGFYPSEKDLFWTHPFIKLDYESYSFAKVSEVAELDYRTFPIDDGKLFIPDASYLVEPVEGLWLLAIDGNVYLPNSRSGYYTSSSVGFNLTLAQKNHQLDWIEKVAAEAKRLNKTLISFSHYPLVDFNDGASEELKALFGPSKFQLNRVPTSETSKTYLDAGLSVHFAGHMHSNDTGVFEDSLGNRLVNIQVPSLAAFPPAYKMLSFPSEDLIQIETEILDSVPRMDEFFDLYQMEWNKAKADLGESWNQEILASKSYLEYTEFHLDELIWLRFLKADWPEPIKSKLLNWNLQDLTYWAGLVSDEESDQFLSESVLDFTQIQVIQERFELDQKTWELLREVSGKTILKDFYRLKNGGDLAFNSEYKFRFFIYSKIFECVISYKNPGHSELDAQLILFSKIFQKIQNGLPSDDFFIDLKKKELVRSEGKRSF
jgi:3',5'-cyclic AMP phosphodiesterase CpdA